MNRKIIFILIVLLLVSCVSAEKVIVVLKDKYVVGVQSFDSDLDKRKFMVKEQQVKVLKKFDKIKVRDKFSLVNGFSAEVDSSELSELKNDLDVFAVYPVREYKLNLDVSAPLINAGDVWSLNFNNNDIKGLDQTVCVVDTGINYTHNALTNAYIGGYDHYHSDSDPMDYHGHGTHVSGIVASDDSTYTGVAPGAGVYVMKVFNDAGGSTDTPYVVKAIEDCVNNKTLYNISVISMSLGTDSYHSDVSCDSYDVLVTDAINLAVGNDINVIVSSGNEANKNGISNPACITNATSVGWTSDSDDINGNSNSANILDLLAPGNYIHSCSLSNGFVDSSGTSMSAPHVSGAVALMRQFLREYNNTNLGVSEAVNVLKRTGVDLNDSNGIVKPRIDVYSAVLSFDNINPDLVLDYPSDTNYIRYNISLNYSASDDLLLDSVWYDFDGSNISLNGNTSLNLSEGDYSLVIYANDSVGNLNFSSVSFSINLSKPEFVSLSPDDDYSDDDGNLSFTCNASSNFELVNISFYHNFTGSFVFNQSVDVTGNVNSSDFNLYDFSDNDNLSWYCKVYDNNSYYTDSSVRDVLVRVNDAPVFILNISNQSWDEDSVNPAIMLSDHFSDEENNIVGYGNTLISNITVSINNISGLALLNPDTNFTGNRSVIFTAYDSYGATADSNNVSLTVNNTADCGDGLVEGSEECDGSNLNGEGCSDQSGYSGGDLSCSSCSFDVSNCTTDVATPSTTTQTTSSTTTQTTIEEEVVEEEEETSATVSTSSVEEDVVEEEIKEIVPEKGPGFFRRLVSFSNVVGFVKVPYVIVVKLWGLIF